MRGKIRYFGFARQLSASSLKPGFATGTLYCMTLEIFDGFTIVWYECVCVGTLMSKLWPGRDPYADEHFVSEQQFASLVHQGKRPVLIVKSNTVDVGLVSIFFNLNELNEQCIATRIGSRPSFDQLAKKLDSLVSQVSATILKGSAFLAILKSLDSEVESKDMGEIDCSIGNCWLYWQH